MHTAIRWIRADLRARRIQAAVAIGVIAGAVLVFVVGLSLLEGTLDPWRGTFVRSKGAHIWIHTAYGTDLQPLARLDGVTALAGPYQTAAAVVVRDGRRTRIELRVMGPELPEIARPLMVRGSWLTTAAPGGTVLERSYAQDLGVTVGDTLTLQSLQGLTRQVRVVGIADTADQVPYPDSGQGIAWALPPVLGAMRPDPGSTQQLVGLRLSDPALTDFVAQRAASVLPEKQMESMSTWRDVRAKMELDDRLAGSFLAMFGIVGLIGAVLAVSNAAGAWVLSRRTDIALLMTLGLTPAQVMRLLLLEQALLGAAGIGVGVVAAQLITTPWLLPFWSNAIPPAAVLPTSLGEHGLIAAGVAAVLLLATLLPAWQGSRVSPAAAVSAAPPGGHLSRLARLAFVLRLPAALVLGIRDAFMRRSRAVLTIVGLAVPMLMVAVGLGCQATIQDFARHPERLGTAGSLTVRSYGMSAERASLLARADPDVVGVYPAANADALLPGQTRTIQVRAVGTSTHGYPYRVAEGRPYRTAGEALAGQGLLNALGAHVGQRVRLKIGDRPIVVHIVGRTIEPERNGEILSVGLDTLTEFQDPASPEFLTVALRPGADAKAVRARLLQHSGRGLDIQTAPDPAGHFAIVGTLLPVLIVILTLIGLANLMTAISIGLHDHLRDAALLRAIGLTPRQVTLAMTAGTSLLALVAVLLGSAAGAALAPWLIDLQGYGSGIGAGIGRAPTLPVLLPTIAAVVTLATLIALVPARRAVRTQAATALQERLVTY